jgi:Ca2+-binding RTX toxin-like protein
VQGGSGDDTIVSGFGPDLLEGGSGNTTFFNVNGFADTVIAGEGNNIAEMDPTGESTLVGNFQYVYDPGFVADAPAPPPDAPIIPSIAVANSAMQSAAAPALIIKPAVTPAVALPVPTVVKGVLTVGSKTATVNQGIAVSQSGTVITVAETSVGVFTFSSSAISSVSVNTGPGSDYVSFNTLDVPASANVGNGNNYVVGGTANETLIGGTGNDTLIGGPGSNLIEGGNGSNSLYGGTGNDTIDGGTGFDNIFPGGFGVSLLNDSESDSIKGGTGTEAVFMNCNADSLVARLDLGTITDVQTGAVTHISGVKNFYAGPGNSLIVTPPTVASFFVNAGSGVGTIFGTGVRAILVGGVGTPTVIANNKGALIDLTGTTGGKTAFYAVTDGTDSLDAGSGQDVLIQLVAAP